MIDKEARLNLLGKVADDDDTLKNISLGVGILTAPVGLAYLLQRKPKLPKQMVEAARKGVTMVEGKLDNNQFMQNTKNWILKNYRTHVIPTTTRVPKKPVYKKGLVVLQEPSQAKFVRGDVTLNANPLASKLENKMYEQRLLKQVGASIPSKDVSQITSNKKLSLAKKLKLIDEVGKKFVGPKGHYLIKETLGAASKGKFPTDNTVKKLLKKHAAKFSDTKSLIKSLQEGADLLLQKELPLKKNVELRIHSVGDQIISSLVSPRWPTPVSATQSLLLEESAKKHVSNVLRKMHNKYPELKKNPIQFAMDVGFTKKGKPVIFETNAGGMSGFLDKRRKRVDLARQLQGKRSLHSALRKGIPVGLFGIAGYAVLKDEKK